MQKLLTAKEVAEALGVGMARVYELSRQGMLPFLVKLGDRQYRYHEQGMQEWLSKGGNAEKEEVESDDQI
jgi:excisionase family DNA binding protein